MHVFLFSIHLFYWPALPLLQDPNRSCSTIGSILHRSTAGPLYLFLYTAETNNVFLFLSGQFQISIVVERPDGREIAKPVELRVMVGDANDNRPTFPQAQYHTVVKELAARGNWQPILYIFCIIYILDIKKKVKILQINYIYSKTSTLAVLS